MAEKDLENSLVIAMSSAATLRKIRISSATSDAQSLADLCHGEPFDIIQDNSRWNQQPKAMPEIIGGMTPDIVLRSMSSTQNRIYIEVKESALLGYGVHDSQAIRYFLHLLAFSENKPNGKDDIRRAFLLAAPTAWFEDERTAAAWKYFVDSYSDLARAFDITLGEIRLA